MSTDIISAFEEWDATRLESDCCHASMHVIGKTTRYFVCYECGLSCGPRLCPGCKKPITDETMSTVEAEPGSGFVCVDCSKDYSEPCPVHGSNDCDC